MASYYLGIGHESGAVDSDLAALVAEGLRRAQLTSADLTGVASIAQKEAAGLVAGLAAQLGLELRYFSAAALEAETPRLLNPSEAVFRQMGCHGVAEAAALAAAGAEATLVLPKMVGKGVTCAIARAA
jgi:cobalamin biosynthesis protein CbiG